MQVSSFCGSSTTPRRVRRGAGAVSALIAGIALAALTPGASGDVGGLPTAVAPPSVTGLAQIGQTVVATPGVWLNAPTTYAYQWETCDADGSGCSEIPGATSPGYLLEEAEVDDAVRVVVTASNAAGSSTAASSPTAVASAPGAPSVTAKPTISGTAEVGYTLTTSDGSWSGSPTSYGYTWRRCDSSASHCSTIVGATAKSYRLTATDVGKRIRSRVKASNPSGSRSATSAPSTTVTGDATPPTAPGSVRTTGTGQTSISVAWNASTDLNGVSGYTLYRNGAAVASTQGTTYGFTGLTCGTSYTLAVDASDAAGNRSTKSTLTATTSTCSSPGDTVPPSTPAGLTAASAQTSITLSWSASTDNVGVTGYGIYNGPTSVGTTASTGYAVTGLTCNTSYVLSVDAFDAAGNRSAKASVTKSTTACSSPPPPTPGSANLWLDTTGGSCTRQATAGGYADAQACSSFQAAENAAQPGDTINIVDGTYPGQEISGTKAVRFRAAGPGRPSFGQLVSAASNLTVEGILIQNRSPQPTPFCSTYVLDYTLFVCAANNTYDNVIVDGLHHGSGDPDRRGGIELADGSGFVFRNGEIRGVSDSKGFQGGADNMVLENNLWHDIRLTPAGGSAGIHNECAYVTGGNDQVWRANRFVNCPVMAMFFPNWAQGPAFRGVLVENNLFTHSLNDDGSWHDGASFMIPNGNSGQNQVNNWIVRYNTFEIAPDIAQTPGTGDDNGSASFYGNLGADPTCNLPEWTISYNVGGTCGKTGEVFVANATNTRTNPNQSPFYVNAPAGDFHLKAGSAATDKGDPSRYPRTDGDGKSRPRGGGPDAGAYESG
jgi:chitodextrinase